MRSLNDWVKELLEWGTPACGLLCAVVGAVLGLLLVLLGLWPTLLVASLAALGALLGGVKDKEALLKRLLNRIIPGKNDD